MSLMDALAKSEFLCKLKFRNSLPDTPFDPKLLQYPFDPERFVKYTPTTLEQNYQHALLTERDMGIKLDLIDRDAYKPLRGNPPLDPADEALLTGTTPAVATPSARITRAIPRPEVSWLRRTSYLASDENKAATLIESSISFGGRSTRLARVYSSTQSSRDKIMHAIQDTFEQAKLPVPPHRTNPRLTAVHVMPIFPDFELWSNMYTQVNFDDEPLPNNSGDGAPPVSAESGLVHEAIIRGYSNKNFCSLLHSRKRRRDWDESTSMLQFDHVRDYVFSRKIQALTDGGSFFFRLDLDNNEAYYNHLETKITLTKKAKTDEDQPAIQKGSVMEVSLRNPDEKERETIEQRRLNLLTPKSAKGDRAGMDEFAELADMDDEDDDQYDLE